MIDYSAFFGEIFLWSCCYLFVRVISWISINHNNWSLLYYFFHLLLFRKACVSLFGRFGFIQTGRVVIWFIIIISRCIWWLNNGINGSEWINWRSYNRLFLLFQFWILTHAPWLCVSISFTVCFVVKFECTGFVDFVGWLFLLLFLLLQHCYLLRDHLFKKHFWIKSMFIFVIYYIFNSCCAYYKFVLLGLGAIHNAILSRIFLLKSAFIAACWNLFLKCFIRRIYYFHRFVHSFSIRLTFCSILCIFSHLS